MSEENFVVLEIGIPRTMRFDRAVWSTRQVEDPELGFKKTVKVLSFHVVEEGSRPADTVFSLISVKAQKEIEPYLVADRYKRYKFTWIKDGPGYTAPRIVTVEPL
jgi:hypothetical protein